MRSYTDSQTVEVHEDGSKTVTTIETFEPVTRKQQAVAAGVLSLLVMAPIMPVVALALYDRVEEARNTRKAKKLAKKAKTD